MIENQNSFTPLTSTTADPAPQHSDTATSPGITLTPNDRGGVTYGIIEFLEASRKSQHIANFETGKDRIDMSTALKNAGVGSLNFNLSDISEFRNPGDAFLDYLPHNNQSNILVKGQSAKSSMMVISVKGLVRLGDIVDSGWS
ncbi:hypothetical protein [Pseudomonas monachiensis]|uniref:Uncharacterized protein n=1 Tax=Pseudomonas monachiensis TaxID=3060212 RepID=A0ABW9H6X9_9PSED